MNVSDALRAVVRVLGQRPAAVLPFFLLEVAVLPTARVPLLIGLAVALWTLASAGRLEPVARALSEVNQETLATGDGAAVGPELVDALTGLATPAVVLTLGAATVVSLLVFLVARAVAGAATLSAVRAALQDEDPLHAGVVGVRTHWTAFVGLTLLRGALLTLAVGILVVATAFGAFGPVVGLTTALVGVVMVAALALLLAALSFAGAAVVTDGVGAIGGALRSLNFVRRRPFAFAVYIALVLGVVVGFGIVGATFATFGARQMATAAWPLLVAPFVDGFTVALYADEAPAPRSTPPLGRRGARTLRRGRYELGQFVRGHPVANLAALATFGVGVVGGWSLTAPYETRLSVPPDVGGAFGAVPLGPFLNIAANNWLVAVGSAYGGLAFGVPALASLLFNGALVGALSGLFHPVPFLAMVVPHGVVEVPALVVAGALGLHLGQIGVGALVGRRSAADVGEGLQRTMYVLVGLGALFVAAAFVEAFLTPSIAQAVVERP